MMGIRFLTLISKEAKKNKTYSCLPVHEMRFSFVFKPIIEIYWRWSVNITVNKINDMQWPRLFQMKWNFLVGFINKSCTFEVGGVQQGLEHANYT